MRAGGAHATLKAMDQLITFTRRHGADALVVMVAIAGVVLGAVAQTVATGNLEYFSTITRGDAILAGCVLGIIQLKVPKALGVTGLVLLVAVSYLELPHDVATPLAILLSCLIVASSIPRFGFSASS